MSLIADSLFPPIEASGLKDPALWLHEALGGRKTASGILVNAKTSLGLSTYFACLRNISEDVATLPLKVYRRLKPRGKEADPGHPIARLLRDPNPQMSGTTFRETMTHWALGWGGGVAEIALDGRGAPSALWPVHPDRVEMKLDQDRNLWYIFHANDGEQTALREENVLHLHGLTSDGRQGYSVANLARETLGLALAAEAFGASFFGNNASIGGVLEHPKKLSKNAEQGLRESWSKRYEGPKNAGRTLVAEEGMQYKAMGIPPEQAQYIQTKQFSVEEVCRWFRMPPHKVQHLLRSTNNNIEHQSIEYVGDTLVPWLGRWHGEIGRKLLSPAERVTHFVEHVVAARLRGDSKTRGEFYVKQFGVGALSSNDIRELENRNPIPGGDVYYRPLNLGPLDGGSREPVGQAPGSRRRGADAASPTSIVELAKKAQARVVADVAARMLQKESNAATRAAKKYAGDGKGFDAWLAKFYDEHQSTLADSFLAPVAAIVELIVGRLDDEAGAKIASVCTSISQTLTTRSKTDLVVAFAGGTVYECCEGWLRERVPSLALSITEDAAELAARIREASS